MSDIIGFEACAKELRRVLDEIETNINSARERGADALHTAVVTETRKLVDFTSRTEPKDISNEGERENIAKIDQAADEARRTIFGDSVNEIIGRLHDRIFQLNKLEKDVRHQAAENQRTAAKMRLMPVRNTIDAMTEMVETAKAAKDVLSSEDADEDLVKKRIEGVLRTITALHNASRKLFESS